MVYKNKKHLVKQLLKTRWLLVPLACRFYFGPDIQSAHGRIPDKLCR